MPAERIVEGKPPQRIKDYRNAVLLALQAQQGNNVQEQTARLYASGAREIFDVVSVGTNTPDVYQKAITLAVVAANPHERRTMYSAQHRVKQLQDSDALTVFELVFTAERNHWAEEARADAQVAALGEASTPEELGIGFSDTRQVSEMPQIQRNRLRNAINRFLIDPAADEFRRVLPVIIENEF